MFKQQAETIYHVGIYCRLSKDDGKATESTSIATQKEMLTRYVREQGWHISGLYIDDGYSGKNFDRPDFQRMIQDIEDGKINCVITKDLSRLGRNYLESGAYIEVYFPEHGVRYISLNDGVDTLDAANVDITPFKNILNEMYIKDLSRKIKSARRTRLMQGKFMGVTAPYGYKKDPADHNHLVIDEVTAPVVQRIFNLAKQGLGISRIRQIMTDARVLRPGAIVFQNSQGSYNRFFAENEDNRFTWSNNSVRGILRNPVYAGHIAGYKRPIPSMKSKRRLSALPEDWVIVRNTHEPIIPPDEWELVQRLITSRRKGVSGISGYDNIFAGLVKCGTCGYALRTCPVHRKKQPDPIDNIGYYCNQYGIYGKVACTQHWIAARELHQVVLEDIRRHAEMALQDDKQLIRRIITRMDSSSKSEITALHKEKKRAQSRLTELDGLFARLFEDSATGKISEHNYISLSSRYELEQQQLVQRIALIEEQLDSNQTATENAELWVNQIKVYAGIQELAAPLLNALIDKITVDEPIIVDGERQQIVNIYYKFIGKISE